MALAPQMTLKEIDESSYVQTYSSSQAGFAGNFNWGPIDYLTFVNNTNNLAKFFGKPTLVNNATFYTAVGYLDYSDSLLLVRSAGSTAKNATNDKYRYITAQISNSSGTFTPGEIATTSDNKQLVVVSATATELVYYLESEQLVADTTLTGSDSEATATIEEPGKSYYSLNASSITGTLAIGDTITGGISSASGEIIEIRSDLIIYQLTTEDDFSQSESVVSSGSATFTVSIINGIIHYSTSGLLIKNIEYFDNLATKDFIVAARYAGILGNSIKVSIGTPSNYSSWEYRNLFDSAPDSNEFHIVIVDIDGLFYNSYQNNILETYSYLSNDPTAVDLNNETSYWRNVINSKSEYIYAGNNDISNLQLSMILSGGVDSTPLEADIINSYKLFKLPKANDCFYYISGLYTANVDNSIIAMAEQNQKTIVFTSPLKASVMTGSDSTKATSVIAWANSITMSNKAYLDCNWRQVFDSFNNSYVWVPCSSAVCGLNSKCDTNNDVWVSATGYTRGILLNTSRLAWEPELDIRNSLYGASVNGIFTDGSDGVVLLGDRTHVIKPSYLRQLAVRKTSIVIEQSVLAFMKYYIGENNNSQTRNSARTKIEQYLREIGSKGAFRRAQVILDDTNNTEQVIDEQKMRCLLKIQYQSTIMYIEITSNIVNSSTQFTEGFIPGTL